MRPRSAALLPLLLFLLSGAPSLAAAPASTAPAPALTSLVERLKRDPRGPFQGIRWFCPDGSVRMANEPCGVPGGRQHGLHKEEVAALAAQGIYLGQILSGTPYEAFLDTARHGSRMKQYGLERWLIAVDEGWIMRGARYYRGAVQVEGEEAWTAAFFDTLMQDDTFVERRFFLLRQLVRDLPFREDGDRSGRIRALASAVAGRAASFVDLKNKIHSQPDASDVNRVEEYRAKNASALSQEADSLLALLQDDLRAAYSSAIDDRLRRVLGAMDEAAPLKPLLSDLLYRPAEPPAPRVAVAAELLWRLRREIVDAPPSQRLALITLSLDVEAWIFRAATTWHPSTLQGLIDKTYVLGRAAAGAGYLELWEWEQVAPTLEPPAMRHSVRASLLQERVDHARRAVGWAAAMVSAEYGPVVERFAAFEPLARGFTDEIVRRSVLLPWGETTGDLRDVVARLSGTRSEVHGDRSAGAAVGLNPGYALGPLQVVRGNAEGHAFDDKTIYLLERPPADLGPVAGIATVTEGNAVSHVQLLARNLGIPNAVLSPGSLDALAPLSGQAVFYAVSPRGRVILKPAEAMTEAEQALFETRQRPDERVAIPTEKLELSRTELLRLQDLRAVHSGRLCGPKAANLGQLASMFPGRVTPGIVIPFGVYRAHLDGSMPGTEASYWSFIEQSFGDAARARAQGEAEAAVEARLLQQLAQLRAALSTIPLQPAFVEQLEAAYARVFGAPLGEVAAFVRSDTNMEDLKEFTGAGLNLTVANVRDRERVLQAIRDVWASPFTERSYRWRQKVLLNPENVYPSILIQRSVPTTQSGVLVTTGLASHEPADETLAFSRGVGGAVEGQAAETWLLRASGRDVLLSPAREPGYTVLPAEGGTARRTASFEQPVASVSHRMQVRQLALDVRNRLPQFPGIESGGPFDVELGFLADRLWLFQARPFVENRRAQASLYLRSLDPPAETDRWIPLASPAR